MTSLGLGGSLRQCIAASLLALPLLMLFPCHCGAVSIMQKMRDLNNLSLFVQLLSDTGLASRLNSDASCTPGASNCFVVFAPSDQAFSKLTSDQGKLMNKSEPDGLLRLAKQHIFTINNSSSNQFLLKNWSPLNWPPLIGKDIGLGRARILQTDSGVLFLQVKESSPRGYHVNNARISTALSDNEASNGILHVLDDVALPLGLNITLRDMLSLPEDDPTVRMMGVSRSLKIFKDWLSRDLQRNSPSSSAYKALLGGDDVTPVRTIFLPTNAAWSDAFLSMSQEPSLSLLSAHVAPNVSLFSGWLPAPHEDGAGRVEFETASSPQLKGRLSRTGDDVTVTILGAAAARLSPGSNLALRDAVVHAVDRLLVPTPPPPRSLAEAARALSRGFHDACARVEACARLLELADAAGAAGRQQQPWTLFAPLSVAELTGPGGKDVAELEQILLLHFVPGQVIATVNMTNQMLVPAANRSGQLRFRRESDSKLWIEGRLARRGFVRSELVSGNHATLSGHLVHALRTPLGLPSLTLRQMAQQLPQLSAAIAAGAGVADFWPTSPSGNLSAFLPDNLAMPQLSGVLEAGARAPAASSPAGRGLPHLNASLVETLRSFILSNLSIIAYDWPINVKSVHRTIATGALANQNASLIVGNISGTDELAVWLQSASVSVTARGGASAGQYQCLDGLLYVLDSVSSGDGPEALMGMRFDGMPPTAGHLSADHSSNSNKRPDSGASVTLATELLVLVSTGASLCFYLLLAPRL